MKLTLEAWRRARGKSQAEMADVCGVHVNTYRRWEENPGKIRYDEALLIADHLKISLEDLSLQTNTTHSSN